MGFKGAIQLTKAAHRGKVISTWLVSYFLRSELKINLILIERENLDLFRHDFHISKLLTLFDVKVTT